MEAMKFVNELFGTLRAVKDDGEIWFLANDVCDVLGYTNMTQTIQDHTMEMDRKALTYKASIETIKAILWTKPNDFSNKLIINESGLYCLIFGSKMERAIDFKLWITKEVLPSIRKNGGYISGQEDLSEEQLKNLTAKIAGLKDEVEKLKASNQKKNQKIKKLREERNLNRFCRRQYRKALRDIEGLEKAFASQDAYTDYLQNKDIERDEEMKSLREKYLSVLRVTREAGIDLAALNAASPAEFKVDKDGFIVSGCESTVS